jgi:hypothetical protein
MGIGITTNHGVRGSRFQTRDASGRGVVEHSAKKPDEVAGLMASIVKAAAPKRKEASRLDVAWAKAAGYDTARRSRPTGLKNGELTVAFETAALRQEVECWRKEEILAKLGDAYPEGRIAKLKCVIQRR